MAWAPDYITSAELKNELNINDALDDVWVDLVVTAASRAIDRHTRRQFGVLDAPATRQCGPATYRAELDQWIVPIPDLMTDDGLLVEMGGVTIAGAELQPVDAADDGRPWTRLALAEASSVVWPTRARRVAVTARWGWSAVPATISAAALLQAQRFYARRDSPYGVAGSPDLGSELRLLAKVDADVAVMLAEYVRPAVTG